ncbi:MAG: hypothetical protein V2I63_01135 [Pseudomonadales bacterium]|jgi:hypothetical protein|nr:hypothetical protein [Pseudomonadales bacterium]
MALFEKLLKSWLDQPLVSWPGLPLPVTTPVEYLGRPIPQVVETPANQATAVATAPAVPVEDDAPRQAA